MEKLFVKPPAIAGACGNHPDHGPEAAFFALRYYPSLTFSRTYRLFPAASLLCHIFIRKVEGLGEYGYDD